MVQKRFQASPDSKVHQAIIRRILTSEKVIREQIARFIGGITLMPNNICNANCVFCSYQFHVDPKRTMSLELFRRALDSAIEMGFVGTVVLTPHAGEPLADPGLCEKIAYAHERGVVRTILTTNGILLGHRDTYRMLLDANPYEVNISTPGLDRDAYKRLYRVDKYDAVMAGLIKLAEYRKEKGADCRTAIRLIVHLDRPEEQAFQEDGWRAIQPYLDDGTLTLLGTSNEFDNWSGSISEDMLPDGMGLRGSAFDGQAPPCDRLIHDLAVLPDGKVRVCSCRYLRTDHDELVIGDVTEAPMKDIYYGPIHVDLIRRVAAGDWPEVCRTCSIYRPVSFSPDRLEQLYAAARDDKTGSHWVRTPQKQSSAQLIDEG